jgi:hypothetical protein
LLTAAAVCSSCGSLPKSDVDVVRDGVLTSYYATTVGKAVDGTLQNGQWSSGHHAKGRDQPATGGVMIQDYDTLELAAGDLVDAVGFPEIAGFGPALRGARVRHVDAISPQVEGKFMSAFIRAVKPASKECCGPACCS